MSALYRCKKENLLKKILLVVSVLILGWYVLFGSTRIARDPIIASPEDVSLKVSPTKEEPLVPREAQEETTQIVQPSPTLIPTPTQIILEGVISIKAEFSSDEVTELFQGELEETIIIIIPECSPNCTALEIDEALGPASSQDGTWVAVLVGNTLYFHSGWNPIQGPWPGEIFRRAQKYDSTVTLCLGDVCYQMVSYVQLDRDEVGEGVFLSQFFNNIEETDLFIVTCDYGFSIGRGDLSPKIVAQLKLLNPN